MAKASIIVANDDRTFLDLMKELLEDADYSVTVLKEAEGAYKEIIERLPDLLILDIVMGNSAAGWHLLDKVKLDPKSSKIPVIVCSAARNEIEGRQEHLSDMGCYVIEKPFDIDDLLATVALALGEGHTKPE